MAAKTGVDRRLREFNSTAHLDGILRATKTQDHSPSATEATPLAPRRFWLPLLPQEGLLPLPTPLTDRECGIEADPQVALAAVGLSKINPEKDHWPAESQIDRDRKAPAILKPFCILRNLRSAQDTETPL